MGRDVAETRFGIERQKGDFSPGSPEKGDHPDASPFSRSRSDPPEFPKTAGSGNDVSRLRIQREEDFQIFVFFLGQVIENEAGEEGGFNDCEHKPMVRQCRI